MTSALIAEQQGCKHPKDRMEAKCPTNNSYVSSDGIWFLMCFGNYNKYCKLVFETLEMDPKYYTDPELNTLEALAENGRYTEVDAAIHQACKKFPYEELEKRFRENDIPFEKIQTVADVLRDEEAFANDQLRRVKYEKQGPTSQFTEGDEYIITTPPFRIASIGDPVLYRSRPIGYDTRKILKNIAGYTDEQVDKLAADGAVLEYSGDPVPASVFEPSYGPNSKKEK